MNGCPCNSAHQREVAVRNHKAVTCFIVACDECDEGRADAAARLVEPKKAPSGWKPPRPIRPLSDFVRELREQSRNMPELWWRVDPGDRERRMPEENARLDRVPVAPLVRGAA